MFCLIIYLPCFDPYVLFSCLVFCSVLSSTERGRPKRSQVARIELHCISVSLKIGFKTAKPQENHLSSAGCKLSLARCEANLKQRNYYHHYE